MVLLNLSDGGSSHSGPLLWPSESMRDGTSGTNRHQWVTNWTFFHLGGLSCAG
jgi:hypothetical protein